MANVSEHYNNLLAEVYSWIYGGYNFQIKNNLEFFKKNKIVPKSNKLAVDLGAGSGFQSIPLAQLGYSVVAIDLSDKLLNELKANTDQVIKTVKDDFLNFADHIQSKAGLVVCMGDTLTHLDSVDTIAKLFNKVYECLDNGGTFVLTFRDLTFELRDLDRFIPVRSDTNKIFTCFLEYEADYVIVHDIIYELVNSFWVLRKSYYKKCRIGFEWCKIQLKRSGFKIRFESNEKGLITIIAGKSKIYSKRKL